MDILKYLQSISIYFTLDNLVIGSIIIVFLIQVICKIYKIITGKGRKLEVVKMNINIAGIGTVNIEVNNDISRIAHKAWIEIMTRKVGILFEEDKDVIVEVYNSWYALFGIIRELLKEIEPEKRNKDVCELEDVLIKILNNGLRPHLTMWQAGFRRWYDNAIKEETNKELPPQEIQKKYNKYPELIEDLKKTNQQMLQFAGELKKII